MSDLLAFSCRYLILHLIGLKWTPFNCVQPTQWPRSLTSVIISPFLYDWPILPVITPNAFQVMLEKLNSTEISAHHWRSLLESLQFCLSQLADFWWSHFWAEFIFCKEELSEILQQSLNTLMITLFTELAISCDQFHLIDALFHETMILGTNCVSLNSLLHYLI